MTLVDVPTLIVEADNEIMGLFGVKPAPVGTAAPGVGASPVVWIYLTNLLNSAFPYYMPFPPNEAGFDQYQYELNLIHAIHHVNAWEGQSLATLMAGLGGAKNYVDGQVAHIVTAINASAGASAGSAIGVAEALYNATQADLRAEQLARAQGDAHAVSVAAALATNAQNAANAYTFDRTHSLGIHLQEEQVARAQGDAHAVSVAFTYAGNAQKAAEAYALDLHNAEATDLANLKVTVEQEITNGVHTAENFATTAAAAAGASAVAQVMASVQPQLDKIKTEQDTCLEPLCDTVTPNAKTLGNVGNLLKFLEGAGIWATLVALVTEAVNDPEAGARVLTEDVGPVMVGAANGVKNLVGV